MAGDSREHSNPIDRDDVTDAERAALLREYLDAFAAEFGESPTLMPLDAKGKAPVIQGRCRLDSAEARDLLVGGEEAVRRIREEGARGFALYAGKDDHGTADIVFVDHDDLDAFPAPTGEPTLTVRSGSGRGVHETYRNAGDVRNARVGDNEGEVRATNWYVVVPGSIHPTGGVYHVENHRPVATLSDDDLADRMRPKESTDGGAVTTAAATSTESPTPTPTPSYTPADDPPDPEAVTAAEPWIDEYLTSGADDRSSKDYAVCRTMAEYGVPEDAVRDLLDGSPKTKVSARGGSYWRRTWGRAVRDAGSDVNSKTLGGKAGADASGDALPVLPSDPTPDRTWRWEDAARGADLLSKDDVHDRCRTAVCEAVASGATVVIDAPPAVGKSRSAAAAAVATDVPITYLTHRRDNREQVHDWARSDGASVYTLPTFHYDCPTASGEHGDEWADRVRQLRERGVLPRELHKRMDPPCQAEGRCPYASQWDFDPEEYDLIIGWTGHAGVPWVTAGRAVVVDEDPGDAFTDQLSCGDVTTTLSAYLSRRDDIPATDAESLRALRGADRTDDVVARLDDGSNLRDYTAACDHPTIRADAPALAYALVAAEDLGNGFERATLPDGSVAVRNPSGGLSIRDPPDLSDAHAVVGLDGTPVMRLWRGRLGVDLDHRNVLDDDERQTYLTDILGHRYMQTTEHVRPYHSGEYVRPERDADLLARINDHHDEQPALISTDAALAQLVHDGGPAAETVDGDLNYANVKSSNQFKDRRVGVVLGAPQLSDRDIQRLAALDGHAVEPDRSEGAVNFGDAGDDYLRHTRENVVAQAALRFGRDGGGATIYLGTAAVPEWLPTERPPRVRGEGEREVLRAIMDHGTATTPEIAADVDVTQRWVRQKLNQLAEEGHVEKQPGEHITDPSVWIVIDGGRS